jgi:hypothetical protein
MLLKCCRDITGVYFMQILKYNSISIVYKLSILKCCLKSTKFVEIWFMGKVTNKDQLGVKSQGHFYLLHHI